MFKTLIVSIFLFWTFAAGAQSQNEITYKDQLGDSWHRWVIVESQENQDLLLVVEVPVRAMDDASTSQVVVERKLFSRLNRSELTERARYFSELKDLEHRDISFYKNRKSLQTKSAKPLWNVSKSNWTLQDEKDFSTWYSANVKEDYFLGEGIPFDCADFALLLRWAYAHDHGLPVANSLSGSGKVFGHFSGRKDWDNLPTNSSWRKNERFKAAVRYLLSSTYTKSVLNDLYPVQLDRDFISPGTVHLNISPGNHHAQVINQVGVQKYCEPSECVTVLYGNLPAREVAFLDVPRFYNLKRGEGGFLRWRWPEFVGGKWTLKHGRQMAGFSLEQFEFPDLDRQEFEDFLIKKLGLFIAPVDRARSMAYAMVGSLYYRIDTTLLGYLNCNLQYCDPKGTMYDDLSTPSKDRRFRERRDEFLALVAEIPASDPNLINLIDELKYPLFYGGKYLVYNYLFNVDGISDVMSSDPSVSFLKRWGIPEDSNTFVSFASQLFSSIWWMRYQLVAQALAACRPDQTPLRCNPNSAEIKQLATHRLDKGLRLFKRELDQHSLAADPSVLGPARELSKKSPTTEHCPWGPDGYCTNFDYLFDGKTYIDDLSSEPTDIARRRYGFK